MKKEYPFAERLKELMTENGLNNLALSRQLGCEDSTIAFWLTGSYLPRHYMLIKLAEYFDCSVHFVLGLTDDDKYRKSKPNVDFMDRFNFCLKKHNVTPYKVAKECGFGQSTITKWTKHGAIPETESLIALSELFGCSVDFLLGRAED